MSSLEIQTVNLKQSQKSVSLAFSILRSHKRMSTGDMVSQSLVSGIRVKLILNKCHFPVHTLAVTLASKRPSEVLRWERCCQGNENTQGSCDCVVLGKQVGSHIMKKQIFLL